MLLLPISGHIIEAEDGGRDHWRTLVVALLRVVDFEDDRVGIYFVNLAIGLVLPQHLTCLV